MWEPLTWSTLVRWLPVLKYIQIHLKTLWAFILFLLTIFHKTFHFKRHCSFFFLAKPNVLSSPFLIHLDFCHSLGSQQRGGLKIPLHCDTSPALSPNMNSAFPMNTWFLCARHGFQCWYKQNVEQGQGQPEVLFSLAWRHRSIEVWGQTHLLPYTSEKQSAHKLVSYMSWPVLAGHSIQTHGENYSVMSSPGSQGFAASFYFSLLWSCRA